MTRVVLWTFVRTSRHVILNPNDRHYAPLPHHCRFRTLLQWLLANCAQRKVVHQQSPATVLIFKIGVAVCCSTGWLSASSWSIWQSLPPTLLRGVLRASLFVVTSHSPPGKLARPCSFHLPISKMPQNNRVKPWPYLGMLASHVVCYLLEA